MTTLNKEDKLSYQKINNEFQRIKSLAFVQSERSNSTGIGKTFEHHLGVKENNLKDPDFGIFEVKSQRELSKAFVTLTTKEPLISELNTNYLRLKFGKPDTMFPNQIVLHTSMFADRYNICHSSHCFKLQNDTVNRKIVIEVTDLSKVNILDNNVFYTYKEIEDSIGKLKNLFFVRAKKETINNIEYFHFTKAQVFLKFNLDKFYKFLNEGKIMYDIRFGVYKSGKLRGKLHNHGPGFRIKRENFKELYERSYTLE